MSEIWANRGIDMCTLNVVFSTVFLESPVTKSGTNGITDTDSAYE